MGGPDRVIRVSAASPRGTAHVARIHPSPRKSHSRELSGLAFVHLRTFVPIRSDAPLRCQRRLTVLTNAGICARARASAPLPLRDAATRGGRAETLRNPQPLGLNLNRRVEIAGLAGYGCAQGMADHGRGPDAEIVGDRSKVADQRWHAVVGRGRRFAVAAQVDAHAGERAGGWPVTCTTASSRGW